MSAPSKPPDSSLIPWSQTAVEGDPIFNAEWYIPIIRALNRRLKAINAMPIAEDSLTWTFAGPYGGLTTGPTLFTFPGEFSSAAYLPYGEANPTLWGYNAAFGDNVLPPGWEIPRPVYGNVGPVYGQLDPGLSRYLMVPTIPNNGTPVGGGFGISSWRPMTQWKVVTYSPGLGVMTYSPLTGNTEDPLDPIQFINPLQTTFPQEAFIADGPLGSPTPWNPAVGTTVYALDRNPAGGAFPTISDGGVVYPTDFASFPWSYKGFYALVINLLCYFVDNSITWAGKTKADIQALCQHHCDWMDQMTGGAFSEPFGFGVGKPFFAFDNIPPLFQTAWPCWPPKTPPAGYPAGQPFGGFTRLREREITSLQDPGTDGQIARFIFSRSGQYEDGQPTFSYDDPSQFYGPAWAVPASKPHPITPIDQGDYATKVMLRQSGKWIVHTNPLALPDILTFYGPPKPGDIIGVHVYNELRAAISLLTDSISDEYVRWGYAQDSSGTQSGDKSAANGSDASNYGHTATATTTTAAYNAPPNPSYGSGREVFSWTMAGNDLSGPYFACASQAAKLNIYSLAHGMTRDVRFWMFTAPIPGVPLADYTFDNSGLAFATYSTYPDAAGTGTDAGQIVLAGTTTGATADHVDLAGYVGSLPQWLPSFPATPSVGSPDQYRGIYLYPLVATCHWTFND